MRNRENSRLYYVWWEIKRRCNDPKSRFYSNYGGRGINVSEEWEKSFITFKNDMGPRPNGATIERINNDDGYNKNNCKWSVSRTEQALNRRVFKINKTGIKNLEVRNDGSYRVRVRRFGKIIVDKTYKDFFDACCHAKHIHNLTKLEAL